MIQPLVKRRFFEREFLGTYEKKGYGSLVQSPDDHSEVDRWVEQNSLGRLNVFNSGNFDQIYDGKTLASVKVLRCYNHIGVEDGQDIPYKVRVEIKSAPPKNLPEGLAELLTQEGFEEVPIEKI